MILQDLEKACRDIEQFDEVLRRHFSLEVTVASSSRRHPGQVRSFAVSELAEAMRFYFQRCSYARLVNESDDTWRHADFIVSLRLVCYGYLFYGCDIFTEEICA